MNAKRLLAVVLSVALLISCVVLPVAVNAESEELDVWDGTAVAPADADSDGVYEINTPEELAWAVANSGGKSYILTTDIYLNDPDAVDWATGAVNEGYEPKEWLENVAFKGNFDGNGHVVYGIYYPVGNNAEIDANRPVGLFPKVSTNTTVKNVGVKMSYLETKGFAGAVVGFFGEVIEMNFAIDSCFSDSTVTLKGKQPVSGNYQFGAGGIIGAFYNSGKITVSNCWSNANTASINDKGGEDGRRNKIVGDIWLASSTWQTTYGNLVMKNCYSVGAKPCPGGDKASFTTFENVYSTEAPTTYGKWTQVSAANMKGSAALENMSGLGDAFSATLGLPVLKIFNKGVAGGTWNGGKDDQILGEGTKESPYLIYTAEQLAYAVNTTANKVFQLQNDIVLNDITVKIEDGVGVIYDANDNKIEDYSTLNAWKSGSFPGTIDGNGHVVRGMFFKGENTGTTAAWQNNFAFIKNATGTTVIENLGIEDSYVSYTNGTAAGLIGYLQSTSPIVRNSYIGDSVYLEGQCVGGILGSGDMSNFGPKCIENCYVLATINCHGTRWGALYAETWNRGNTNKNMSIINFYSTTRLADGVGGYLTLQTCYGDVKAEKGYIGSIHDGNTMRIGNAFNYVEGGLPVLKVFDDREMAWGGLGGAVFAGGTGTEEDPYLVSDPAQLAYMVYSGGGSKYYELTNDIVITDLDAVDWSTGEVKEDLGYTPVHWFGGTNDGGEQYKTAKSETDKFYGHVNGNGYKVSGLYYEPYYAGRDIETEGKWYTCVGLIPATSDSTISNIMLANSYIVGGRFVGAFSGHSKNSTYSGLVADNTVTVKGVNVGKDNGFVSKEVVSSYESASAAGILGYAHGTFSMDNCGTSAKITSSSHLNGLIGTQWNTVVNLTNSYCVGYSPIAVAGGGSGKNNITNVYGDVTAKADPAVTTLETAQITGKDALDNMPGLDATFWYGVSGQGPLFRSYGARITDISCDGKFDKASELVALRVGLITGADLLFADINADEDVNICDLVAFAK